MTLDREERLREELRALAEEGEDEASSQRVRDRVAAVQRRRSRTRWLALAAAVAVVGGAATVIAGMPGNEGPEGGTGVIGAAECTPRIRVDGVVYELSVRIDSVPARDSGSAAVATCEDSGEDPAGAGFPDDAERVDVLELDGVDRSQAVGVRIGTRSVDLYLALGVGSVQRERIERRLTG